MGHLERTKVKEKNVVRGLLTGINDAIYLKNKYQNELDRAWKSIVDMVHFIEDKNKELKINANRGKSLKEDISAYYEKRGGLFESLNNLLNKESSHEFKMWQETQKHSKVNSIKSKQKFKDTDIDEINYNSMMQYIKQYPEYQTKSSYKRIFEDIENVQEGIRQKKKEYHKIIGIYNAQYSNLLKDIQKAKDKIIAFNKIYDEGTDKLNNCRYRKSLDYKISSEKTKEAVKLDTLSYRVEQFQNTLDIIQKEHAKNQVKELTEMEY